MPQDLQGSIVIKQWFPSLGVCLKIQILDTIPYLGSGSPGVESQNVCL